MIAKLKFAIFLCTSIFSTLAGAVEYTYTGADFQVNTLPKSTHITVYFFVDSELAANQLYDVNSSLFTTLEISDGVNHFAAGTGTFFPWSQIQTGAKGQITDWFIGEVLGVNKPLTTAVCCTAEDTPLMYTVRNATDGSIQTPGFYGVGQTNFGYAYNNGAPGLWVIGEAPEPATYAMLIAGLALTGLTIRRKQRS